VSATRTSHRWQSLPGSFDALHTDTLFQADNRWGIPLLAHTPLKRIPAWLAPFRQRIQANRKPDDGAIHFFVDDYRFESVWSRPQQTLAGLRPFTTLLTPDFSLYRDWPLSAQLWNTYRNRWCGCFWQSEGFSVIPTVSWSTADSFDFCFLGIPRRSVVAVATIGLRLDEWLDYGLFLDGFSEMVLRLEPALVLCYGKPPAACHELAEVATYPTRWTEIRAARRQGYGRQGQ
jgi:hypothetical protein